MLSFNCLLIVADKRVPCSQCTFCGLFLVAYFSSKIIMRWHRKQSLAHTQRALRYVGLTHLDSACLNIIPEDVFVPVVQYILFSNEVIVFATQKDSTVMFNCSLALAASQRRLHDTWRWYTISSPLLFLSAFLAVNEASHSNATMMAISLCLSKRVST